MQPPWPLPGTRTPEDTYTGLAGAPSGLSGSSKHTHPIGSYTMAKANQAKTPFDTFIADLESIARKKDISRKEQLILCRQALGRYLK